MERDDDLKISHPAPGYRGAAPDETDDVFYRFHRFRGDRLGASGTVGEYRVDVGGVDGEPLHLGADRAELRHREIDQRGLEGGELAAAELRQHGALRGVRERRI